MKKIIVLIAFTIFIPIASSQNYRICSADNCQQSNDFPCFIQLLGLWCCRSDEFPHTNDCYGTKILLSEIPSQEFCNYENFLGIYGDLNSLKISTNAKYDIIQYDEIKINCNLNNNLFCVNETSPGLIICANSSSIFNFHEYNHLVCNISHPKLFIVNSTSINFKTLDFDVKFDLTEIQTGTSIIPIYFKFKGVIPEEFILKLITQNKNVRIYEETKKTGILNCKQEEKISYIIETISPGTVNLNLQVKPNLSIPCSQDSDCSIFENGKCIDTECWASYNFLIYVKSKIQEFDYTYFYFLFLSILALTFIILLIEAIVVK